MSYLRALFASRYQELNRHHRAHVFRHSMVAGYAHALKHSGSMPTEFAFNLGVTAAFRLTPVVVPDCWAHEQFRNRAQHISATLISLLAIATERHGFNAFHDFDINTWTLPLLACPTIWTRDILKGIAMSLNNQPDSAAGALDPAVMAKLTMHLADLEQSLLTNDPLMPQHLRNSHALILSYPESVHMLEERDAVGLIIKALQKHTSVEIVKATAAKPRASSARASKVSASDL